jgi:hypothetical protein
MVLTITVVFIGLSVLPGHRRFVLWDRRVGLTFKRPSCSYVPKSCSDGPTMAGGWQRSRRQRPLPTSSPSCRGEAWACEPWDGFYETESRVDHPGTASSRAQPLDSHGRDHGGQGGWPYPPPCPRLPVPDSQYPPGNWFWDHGGQGGFGTDLSGPPARDSQRRSQLRWRLVRFPCPIWNLGTTAGRGLPGHGWGTLPETCLAIRCG